MSITPHRTPDDTNKDFQSPDHRWGRSGSGATGRVLDTPERAALAAVTAVTAQDLRTPQLPNTTTSSTPPTAPTRAQLYLPSSRVGRAVRRLSASPGVAGEPHAITPMRQQPAASTPDTGYATAASATPGTNTFGVPHSGPVREGGLSRHRAGQSRLLPASGHAAAAGVGRLISAVDARREASSAAEEASQDPLRTWQQPEHILGVHSKLLEVKRRLRAAMWTGHATASTMCNNLVEMPRTGSGGVEQPPPAIRDAPPVYGAPVSAVQIGTEQAISQGSASNLLPSAASSPVLDTPAPTSGAGRKGAAGLSKSKSRREQRGEASRNKDHEALQQPVLQLERSCLQAIPQRSHDAQLAFLNLALGASTVAGGLPALLRQAALKSVDTNLSQRAAKAVHGGVTVRRVWGKRRRGEGEASVQSHHSCSPGAKKARSTHADQSVASAHSAIDADGVRITKVIYE